MASIISVDTLQDSAGSNEITTANVKTAFDDRVKAWVHFDQQGTFGVKNSINQSSMSDNGTGDATLNLTNNMGSAYYSFSACAGNGSTGTGISFVAPKTSDPTASAIRMVGFSHAGGVADREFNGWSLHGDLA